MTRLLLLLALCVPASAAGPDYFTGIRNSLSGKTDPGAEYSALQKMVQLADAQGVRLTLFFSPQYAAFISSDPVRAAELAKWGITGHETGALRLAPDREDWDGYSELPRASLEKLRPRGLPARVPGREEYLAELKKVSRSVKTVCTLGKAEKDFLQLSPYYEACGGGTGANSAALTVSGKAGAKTVSSARPSGKQGVEAAGRDFKAMKGGVFGAVFSGTPSDFGSYYAWLGFLRERDPGGGRSRTVSAALESGLLPERETVPARKAKPAQPTPQEAVDEALSQMVALVNGAPTPQAFPRPGAGAAKPKLKPVPGFSERGRRVIFRYFKRPAAPSGGFCGDGRCSGSERVMRPGCPRDCGVPRR